MMTHRAARRAGEKLASIRVWYDGQEYERDLTKCRVALRSRQIEGWCKNMGEFALGVGLSVATVSKRLMGAEAGRKDTTDRILAGLKLDFDAVHKKLGPTENG